MTRPAVSPLRSKKLVEPTTSVNSTVKAFLCLRSCSSISARAFRSASTSSAECINLEHDDCEAKEGGRQWPPGNMPVVRLYLGKRNSAGIAKRNPLILIELGGIGWHLS